MESQSISIRHFPHRKKVKAIMMFTESMMHSYQFWNAYWLITERFI